MSQSIKGVVHVASHKNQTLEAVKVYLFNSQQQLLDSTITDVNGSYRFDSLPFGGYRIGMYKPWDFTGVRYSDVVITILAAYNIIPLDTLSKLALDVDLDQQITIDDAGDMFALMTDQIDSVPLDQWVYLEPEVIVNTLSEYEEDIESIPAGRRKPLPPTAGKEFPQFQISESQYVFDESDFINYNILLNASSTLSGFDIELEIPGNLSILDLSSDYFELSTLTDGSRLRIIATPVPEGITLAQGDNLLRFRIAMDDPDEQEVFLAPVSVHLIDEQGNNAATQAILPRISILNAAPQINIENEIRITNINNYSNLLICDMSGKILRSISTNGQSSLIISEELSSGLYMFVFSAPNRTPYMLKAFNP